MKMRFTIPYGTREKITDELYAKLVEVCDLPKERKEYWGNEIEGDIEAVVDLIGPVEVTGRMTPWITNHFVRLVERIERLEIQKAVSTEVPQAFNQKVNVHVPGLGLLLLDEIQVMEDCCTDLIQKELDNGWRIVAVCPQPDSRRPDYVLGRAKPKE